ncbi:MAG: BlaI/MecI/CopY family transcriptional regulator [Desulfitobacteriaceae bacterium]|jgi:BlaI family penicillinase repressor|nr:BlaI/MecI/CopY family transcriptional regulator [Desulfitobacteriaceae bacterium]MDD4753407.1 BlaI/MecI/CopY family transcriptional regulator [Desulfitobacteriaceae bacterium]
MENIKRLPDSELEIMMIIWEAGHSVPSAYIMDKLSGNKNWANTTVLNFLARLVDRGFLEITKQGRTNYYHPIIDEQDYLNKESKSFMKRMHMSSLKNFVAALYDGNSIDTEELEELKQYVEEVANKNKGR